MCFAFEMILLIGVSNKLISGEIQKDGKEVRSAFFSIYKDSGFKVADWVKDVERRGWFRVGWERDLRYLWVLGWRFGEVEDLRNSGFDFDDA